MARRDQKFYVTRVINKASTEVPVGFLGSNGVTLGPANSGTAYYDHRGILENDLTDSELDALRNMMDDNDVDVLYIPTAYGDGIYKNSFVLEKSFSAATGGSTAGIYDSSNGGSPTKFRVIDGFVGVDEEGAAETQVWLSDGSHDITDRVSISTGGVDASGAIKRFSTVTGAHATVASSGDLILGVTGNGAALSCSGKVYVTAIRVE
jgi:hypothetical protein